jgi:hypothetical protein
MTKRSKAGLMTLAFLCLVVAPTAQNRVDRLKDLHQLQGQQLSGR